MRSTTRTTISKIEERIPIEEVLPHVTLPSKARKRNSRLMLGRDDVNVSSLRLSCFKEKGIVCVFCGLEAQYFVKDYSHADAKPHVNLYGMNARGKEILFTKDHILPKSRGGKDSIENMQTACEPCNQRKGHQMDVLPGAFEDISEKEFDARGDILKNIEASFESRVPEDKLIMVRLDGRGFSRLTKKFPKPFCEGFTQVMRDTALAVSKEANSVLTYVQSDEITLVVGQQDYFDRRIQKICSVLASTASVAFTGEGWPGAFDARVFGVSLEEADEFFKWRYWDCRRNSMNSTVRYLLGHEAYQGMTLEEMFKNHYEDWMKHPAANRCGTFLWRERETRRLSVGELELLHPNHTARKNPNAEYTRNVWREKNVETTPEIPKVEDMINARNL